MARTRKAENKAGQGTGERQKKVQISFGVDPDLLAAVDMVAASLSISRAATISLACTRLVEAEKKKGK